MIRRRTFLLYGASAAALGLADAALAAARRGRGAGNPRGRGAKGQPAKTAGDAGSSAADRAVNAANLMWLHDASGMGARDYPMRIGRPFVQGEISGVPQAVIAGSKLPTQADIKARWPDGSVKQAILSFVVPQIPSGGTVAVSFANQAVVPGEAMTREQMLDRGFDFETVMEISGGGKTQTASARTMLSNGDYTVWCKGPIATTVLIADHSAARKYDFGLEQIRPLRPIFHATFWPGLKKVQIRAIGENSNTEALQDVLYALVVKAGLAMPREMFRQDEVTHYAATRWTRSFWIGGDPNPEIDIDHNIAYLAKTFAFPPFDPALKIPEQTIAQAYTKYMASPRELYETGGWQKAMNAAGGRGDLGPYTANNAMWLLCGDHRMFEVVSGQADLAGAWPMHVREGDPAKYYDSERKIPALGRPISIYARPSLWLFDERGNPTPEDSVDIKGARIIRGPRGTPNGNWHWDGAHQPDPFSALYTLTGDYFYLEQIQFWASATAFRYNPSYKGPAPSGGVYDEVRGDAWVLRGRVHAAYLAPDGSPEKVYFSRIIDDAICFWEGMHGIQGTRFENTPIWKYAKANRTNYNPYLHVFRVNEDTLEEDRGGLKANSFTAAGAMWQTYFVIFELGRAKEKGFPTGPLLKWTGEMLTGQFNEPGYSPFNVQRYHTAFRDVKNNWYRTWTETLASYSEPEPTIADHDVCDGYISYAYGASTMLLNEPGGRKAYEWLLQNAYLPRRARYVRCPKWAYVART